MRLASILRVEAKIEFTDSCWLWTGATSTAGYGRIRIDKRLHQAHRVTYELLVGPIPEGLDIDHLCRVRRCVNPAHLEPVTRRENLLRGETLTAENAAKTHCSRGHAYTPANTIMKGGRWRNCRACTNR